MANRLLLTLTVLGLLAVQGCAASLSVAIVASWNRPLPSGLAFDGGFLWWGDSNGVLHQMTTSGADTGLTTVDPIAPTGGLGAGLAWSGTQLVSASSGMITFFDPITAGHRLDVAITAPVTGSGPVDGMDFDHGEIWYDQDRSNVFRLTSTGSFAPGPNPVLGGPIGGAGAYSGVERIDVGQNSFLIVMTAPFGGPFELCQTTLTGVGIGCTSDLGKRYFDLAFDGRYLYGAAFSAGTIDKIDLTMDGVSILVPEPSDMFLMIAGLLAFSLTGYRYGRISLRRRLVSLPRDRDHSAVWRLFGRMPPRTPQYAVGGMTGRLRAAIAKPASL